MYITDEPIHLEQFFLNGPNPDCGALVFFAGLVRNHDQGRSVKKLHYECYSSMADKKIAGLIGQAKSRWNIGAARASHRVGTLMIGEVAVAIAVSSAHREEAFSACRFLIEGIKREVPIWKKQFFEDGSSEWSVCRDLHEMIT